MRVWPLVLVPLLAAAGCGGDDPAPTAATSATTAPAVVGPTQVPGLVDPLAISSFTCVQDSTGAWQASGVVENSTKKARDYRVTVFIGEQTGPARVVDLDRVQAGGSVPFTLDPIVAAPEGPCRIQALVKAG